MRATPKRFLKTLFLGSIMCFVIINMNLFVRTGSQGPEIEIVPLESGQTSAHKARNQTTNGKNSNLSDVQFPQAGPEGVKLQQAEVPKGLFPPHMLSQQGKADISKNGAQVPPERAAQVQNSIPLSPENISRINESIREINHQQNIYNLDKFDLTASESTIVIVVQVHNRDEYLHYLIDSLRNAKNIEQTLLVFSHDYYSEEINRIVKSIDFCPTMQIFYPEPIQLHPNSYPGDSPEDCPRNAKKDQAMKMKCINAAYPDKYGHYREAKWTQTKHHWFWKIAHVFDFLSVTKNFVGPVLFIEEDHYLVEDFIPVLHKMYRLKETACKDCSIFTIGTYDKNPAYGTLSSRGVFQKLFGWGEPEETPKVHGVDIMNWISSKHNMGMSLNRETWEKIKACAEQFCNFDDYNWDWSLQYIGQTCIKTKLKVMVSKSPRIYHIGECGVHHKGKNCNPKDKVKHIEALLATNKANLFPSALQVAGYPRTPTRVPKPNGGWGDIRDHLMCTSFKDSSTHTFR